MPPRFAYWTILIDNAPTAFRARDPEELAPTLAQLKRTNQNVAMKWFARGRLWESKEQEHEDFIRGKTEERRGRDWRPGGDHKDPRARFDKEKHRRDKRERREERDERFREARRERPSGDRPWTPKPAGDRPSQPKPAGERPWRPKPPGDRQWTPKPSGDRPWKPKPAGDRPWKSKPAGDRRDRPWRPKGGAPAKRQWPSRPSGKKRDDDE